jgi:hypothetical protein
MCDHRKWDVRRTRSTASAASGVESIEEAEETKEEEEEEEEEGYSKARRFASWRALLFSKRALRRACRMYVCVCVSVCV